MPGAGSPGPRRLRSTLVSNGPTAASRLGLVRPATTLTSSDCVTDPAGREDLVERARSKPRRPRGRRAVDVVGRVLVVLLRLVSGVARHHPGVDRGQDVGVDERVPVGDPLVGFRGRARPGEGRGDRGRRAVTLLHEPGPEVLGERELVVAAVGQDAAVDLGLGDREVAPLGEVEHGGPNAFGADVAPVHERVDDGGRVVGQVAVVLADVVGAPLEPRPAPAQPREQEPERPTSGDQRREPGERLAGVALARVLRGGLASRGVRGTRPTARSWARIVGQPWRRRSGRAWGSRAFGTATRPSTIRPSRNVMRAPVSPTSVRRPARTPFSGPWPHAAEPAGPRRDR